MKRIRLPGPGLLAASLAVLLLPGCNRNNDPSLDDDHHHGEEPKTAQITVWGDRHEIFAEHRFVVANLPTQFVTHVTDLKTLEPRREGAIKFQLRLGEEVPIEQTEMAPARAGIYEPMLTFPKAGDWNVTVVVPTEDDERTIALPPVKVFATQHDADHGEAMEVPEGISILKEQQWKILCGTELATKRRLVERLRLPALVATRPGSQAQVVPPIAGRLLLPPGQPMPMVGDKVESGQTLALIQPSVFEVGARFVEAEGEVVRAKLALEQADLTLKRTQKLAQAEAKSERELREAEFALKAAQARYGAAQALQATYGKVSTNLPDGKESGSIPTIELKSPIAGTLVAQLGAAVGEFISAARPVFTVLDSSMVFLEAEIPEANVNRLASAQGATYEPPDEAGRFISITGEGGGRLVYLGLQVDPATRTVPLVYEVKNEDAHLRVGQALDLHVETARSEDALAIPDSAIVDEDSKTIAFVQVSGETFQKRDLKLGIKDGNWVQVLSGLAEGERVVTKGAYAVRLASVSTAIPAHGHVH